jgi:hypothetical protein
MAIPTEEVLILPTLLAIAAGWTDYRSRRIPNWLTVSGLLLGIVDKLPTTRAGRISHCTIRETVAAYLDQLERSLVCQVGSMSCCIRTITPIHLWELRASG